MSTAVSGPSVYDFSARAIDGSEVPLRQFEGRVLLVVNVASQCGFTSQYGGLEELWRELRGRGFAVLGFPCNQFGGQEPGDEASIQGFCQTRFDVSFPMFAKVEVNGPGAHPLFRYLEHAAPGIAGSEAIKWNFTKFLVDRQGRAAQRFGSVATPARIRPVVEALLASPRAE